MPLSISPEEILETIRMVESQNLDIRTITMGISLRDCRDADPAVLKQKIYEKIVRFAANLVRVGEDLQREYGIPIINKRISVTPISMIADGLAAEEMVDLARVLDRAAETVGVNFIGGYSSLVHKGFTVGDRNLIES
ncbi:MAG: DUF711 family protein, partial [Syntrophomonadaceae bacterium]|nr:DUF711 family protein [Syntrophomonadaceae bacterium]